jgi:hypothetical protein
MRIELSNSRRGSAVLVVLALLSILLLLAAVNIKTLNWLEREVKLVDKHQVQRLKWSRPTPPAGAPAPQPSPP